MLFGENATDGVSDQTTEVELRIAEQRELVQKPHALGSSRCHRSPGSRVEQRRFVPANDEANPARGNVFVNGEDDVAADRFAAVVVRFWKDDRNVAHCAPMVPQPGGSAGDEDGFEQQEQEQGRRDRVPQLDSTLVFRRGGAVRE